MPLCKHRKTQPYGLTARAAAAYAVLPSPCRSPTPQMPASTNKGLSCGRNIPHWATRLVAIFSASYPGHFLKKIQWFQMPSIWMCMCKFIYIYIYIYTVYWCILGHLHVSLYVLHPQTSKCAPGQLLIHRCSCVRRDTTAELHSSTTEHGRWSYRVEPHRVKLEDPWVKVVICHCQIGFKKEQSKKTCHLACNIQLSWNLV